MTTTTTITQSTASTPDTRSIALQLKTACAVTIGFSLLIGLGSHPSTDFAVRWLSDLLFWPLGDPVDMFTNEARLVAAILGGVMTGFGLLFWMLTDALIDDDPKLLRKLILTVLTVWFVIDSAGSVAAGAPLNVIGNIGFLAMYVLPARRL